MRTNDRLSATTALARLLTLINGLRRSLSARHPAMRWGLGLGVIVALVTFGYWAASSLTAVGVRYVASGRRFSSEDLIKICRALDEHRIDDYRLDDRRIAVSADDFDQASALLAKLDLGQHSIDEIRTQSNSMTRPWQTSDERRRLDQLAHERILEAIIGQQSGVVWSLVSIHHPRPATGYRMVSKPSAFVYLETERDRQLPSRTVQAITTILRGYEPELDLHAITVMDRRGHRYLDPSNPSLGEISRNRAREEELSEKILEKLDWIKGVRVLVQVTTPQRVERATEHNGDRGTPTNLLHESHHSLSVKNDEGSTSAHRPSASSTIVVNQPVTLELDPAPLAHSKPIAVTARPGDAATPAIDAHLSEPSSEGGRVLINVPRSFYYNALVNRAYRDELSPEEFQAIAARTENHVKKTVELIVPQSGAWRIDVDTIPDELSLTRRAVLPYSAESRRKVLDWGIVGAAGAAISILAAVGAWVHIARCSVRAPESETTIVRYRSDVPSESGPSERVRELVRRDPQAAASVLQRWTAQGDGTS
jgi:hypothetical protein